MWKLHEHLAVFEEKGSILYAGHWDEAIYLSLPPSFSSCIKKPYNAARRYLLILSEGVKPASLGS